MKPVQIGQGFLGPIYGVRDPKTGQFRVIDPKTGQYGPVVQPGQPGGAQSSVTAQNDSSDDDSSIPSHATPVSGQVLRNEEYLSELKKTDPGTAAVVQGIANYDLDPAKVTSMRGNERKQIMGAVMQYDPSFSLPFYASRAAAIKEFNAGGPNSPAGTITAGNTAIQHLGELSDYGEKIGGASNWGPLNSTFNKIDMAYKGAENDPDLGRYDNALGRFAEEATKFYRGIGGTESDIARAISDVGAAQSPIARRAAIAEQARLMQSKINALQDRYQTAMGGPPGWQAALRQSGQNFPILQQHSTDAMKRILAREAADSGTAPIAPVAAAPAAVATPNAASTVPASPLDSARAAIAKGAPRDAVIQRLKANGIDPAGL
jgi:hypothetical protein